jgi:Mrp family chromosome partitioning ATPase
MVDIPAISIISGKGGVGKTIVSSSVILSLAEMGYSVGALDADYSNPNLGRFMQVSGDIQVTKDRHIVPVRKEVGQGMISFFSIESVIGDKGVGMRGEDYAAITRDVIEYADWDVDIMVVDLPAAISDEWRTILSAFNNYYMGSIIVAQPSHLETTERVVRLHKINGVPIIGLVENMVSFTCPHCGTTYQLFGPSASDALAERYGVKVLAKIPIDPEISSVIGKSPVKLKYEVVAPIIDAVKATQPRKLGFMEELKSKTKEFSAELITRAVVESLKAVNSTVDIKALQSIYPTEDGTTIALVLTNNDGEQIKSLTGKPLVYNFRVSNGKLLMVENPKSVDVTIAIKTQALIWSILGEKKLPDGTTVPYTIMDAYLNGDARVYGAGSVVRAIRFYKDLYESSREQVMPVIRPMLEAIS